MARIVLSALVDAMSGKFNGCILQMRGNTCYRRAGGNSRQPRTVLQQENRQLWSYFSGSFDELPAAFKANWTCYSSMVSSALSGFNGFMKNNQQLLCAGYTSLVRLFDAPASYSPPSGTTGFALSYNSGTDEFEASWTAPDSAVLFVQIEKTPITGYRDSLFPAWTLHETTGSFNLISYISASDYAVGTQMRVRVRVINLNGEISPYSATLTAVKT